MDLSRTSSTALAEMLGGGRADELKALKEVKSQMERDFEAKTAALTSSIVDLTKQKQNTEQA